MMDGTPSNLQASRGRHGAVLLHRSDRPVLVGDRRHARDRELGRDRELRPGPRDRRRARPGPRGLNPELAKLDQHPASLGVQAGDGLVNLCEGLRARYS